MTSDPKSVFSTKANESCDGLVFRDANESDVEQIRDIYLATYGDDYAYPEYYDLQHLKKTVFSEDTVFVVAEDSARRKILGTASVLLDTGAFADLVGEFGRLAVHPEGRHRGIGQRLMDCRIERVKDRLHVGIADNRTAHPFSQKISLSHGFFPVGLLPMKLKLKTRESVSLFVRYFGESLSLRRNHPHVIPEASALAELALDNCGLAVDTIVDAESSSYVSTEDYEISALTAQGYASLLRFERGRVCHREVFGPVQLHYGLFKVNATHTTYLLAKKKGSVVGAVGFTTDPVEQAVRVIELISVSDDPIRFLLNELVECCRSKWNIEYIEVDVSAYAPRMQRTLLELGFLPAAYVPAMVFHAVERLDAIKMVRLLVPFRFDETQVIDAARPVVDTVVETFASREVEPRVARAAATLGLFHGLNNAQSREVARICSIATFNPGEMIFQASENDGVTHVLLKGKVEVTRGDTGKCVGTINRGECLGEMSLLCSKPHSATVTATSDVETAVFSQADLDQLIRRRPDIGVVLYRNLAIGIGRKLWRADHSPTTAGNQPGEHST